jgi:multiple sugar transport system permease protein
MAAGSTYAKRRRVREAGLAYLFLLPSALIIGAFGLWPLIQALFLSLHEYRLTPGPFIGLRNYDQALHDPDLAHAFGVTLYYVVGTVPTTLILGYLLAELLHARIRGLAFYRTLFFMPYIVSPVAAAAVWKWILNPNFGIATAAANGLGWEPRWLREETGVVTLLGQWLHFTPPEWAAGPSLALVCIIMVTVWQSLGFAVVVLLAGLAAVPADITDAARIDGARGRRLMLSVKLPLLSPTLFFLLIVFTIRAFQVFTQIYVMSVDGLGGPNYSTRNVTLYIVQAFNEQNASLGPGYGAAIAMLLFLVILALTLIQFRVLGRRVHYG